MAAAAFHLSGVEKRFGDWRLGPLDLAIVPHAVTALIGASGSGKSTLLRLLAGLIEPDAGSIRVRGEPLGERSRRDYLAQLGYVIQSAGLFPHLTGAENALLPALNAPAEYRLDSDAARARLNELAELVHLPVERLRHYPNQLSGGQRQRVGLIRALMLKPALLFLDEPLSALDPLVRHDLQQELGGIFSRLDMTVILVTHDMAEAAQLADEMILLRGGAVEQRGKLEDLRARPASDYVRHFLTVQQSAHLAPEDAA